MEPIDPTLALTCPALSSSPANTEPYSLEAQETKLQAFLQSQPGEWTIVAVYSDDASGASTERDDLQKMLRAARAGLFDTLLVYRVDRLSRRLRDLVRLLDDLAEAEVAFRSATEPKTLAAAPECKRMLGVVTGIALHSVRHGRP
jgi:DNA invertase Pin-like site-specific DNA recombinase